MVSDFWIEDYRPLEYKCREVHQAYQLVVGRDGVVCAVGINR